MPKHAGSTFALQRLTSVVVLLIAGVTACGEGAGGEGKLSADWKGSGKTSGRLATGASANWCAAGHLLEIMAISNDSGVAVLLYPGDGVKSGTFTVVDPLHVPVHAGAAAVAARWPDNEQIIGFRGVDGSATLTVEGGIISGSIRSSMVRPGAQPESLAFSATFSALKADSGPAACPPDSGNHKVHADSSSAMTAPDSAR